MKYNPEIHHRRSIRLRGYDYSRAGAYSVTLCTLNRLCLFGEIVEGEMRLNEMGRMVASVWDGLPEHYPHVELDAMVIMPNHVHGIIVLTPVGAGLPPVGAGFKPALGSEPPGAGLPPVGAGLGHAARAGLKPAPTAKMAVRHGLSEIVRALKTFSTRRINECYQTPGAKLWQRNYWEHIVRNEPELNRIREYIQNNPMRWELDKLHPAQPQFGQP